MPEITNYIFLTSFMGPESNQSLLPCIPRFLKILKTKKSPPHHTHAPGRDTTGLRSQTKHIHNQIYSAMLYREIALSLIVTYSGMRF